MSDPATATATPDEMAQAANETDPETETDPAASEGDTAQGTASATVIVPPDIDHPKPGDPPTEPEPETTLIAAPTEPPMVGRQVHYVLDRGPHAGECRVAFVARDPWGGELTPLLNLVVICDGSNDDLPDGRASLLGALTVWRTSVHYSADHMQGNGHNAMPGTWHWFGNQAGAAHAR